MDSSVVGIIQLIIDYAPERHKIEMRPEPQRTEDQKEGKKADGLL
jgi:hypothetical protein